MNSDLGNSPFGLTDETSLVDQIMDMFDGTSMPTRQDVEETVDEMLTLRKARHLADRREWVVVEVLRRTTVSVDAAEILENQDGHEPWLDDVNKQDWRLWQRLKKYLQSQEGIPPRVVGELDHSTNRTLSRLESPHRSGCWDRRGMVVGHVQSGKTTHYSALAAKALDAGYRIVVILAGMHNNLRSQTHARIDRDVTGRNSSATSPDLPQWAPIGVEILQQKLGLESPNFGIQTSTTADENGDFRIREAQSVYLEVAQGTRLVMVVKKNSSVLRNLRDWFQGILVENPIEGRRIPHPVLVIDDEADQASMNTKNEDEDPSTINRLIREMLMSFDRVGFVAYTATPFANVFADPNAMENDDRHGPDLFPKSFIVSLRAPSNYIGPSQVFGSPGDEPEGLAERNALPMHVEVVDGDAWVPPRHRKDHDPGPLPDSLVDAVRLFALVCAARCCRGDETKHNSMLVHVTRFKQVQLAVRDQVDQDLSTFSSLVQNGARETLANKEIELRELWEQEVVAKHSEFVNQLGELVTELPAWASVWERLLATVDRIKVMAINGDSSDVLAYKNNSDRGFWVIAIGGDKLSRGLTLEGLSVSYFLRTSRAYDTLMQMGRWFGYRPNYADLCRVYTTGDLVDGFRQISLATEELRRDFHRMAVTGAEPEHFGLRVRTPSDGLLITAANKLRRGEDVQVRFAGELIQALRVPRTGEKAIANRRALEQLIDQLNTPLREVRGKATPWFVWHHVRAAEVLRFLSAYHATRTPSFTGNGERLREYIRRQVDDGELVEWTVCLMTGTRDSVDIKGLQIKLVKRTPNSVSCPPDDVDYKAVAGRREELVDLNEDELAAADGQDRQRVREIRPPQRGLLILYPIRHEDNRIEDYVLSAAVSLPTSQRARPLTYTVNEVYRRQELFLLDDEDELS